MSKALLIAFLEAVLIIAEKNGDTQTAEDLQRIQRIIKG